MRFNITDGQNPGRPRTVATGYGGVASGRSRKIGALTGAKAVSTGQYQGDAPVPVYTLAENATLRLNCVSAAMSDDKKRLVAVEDFGGIWVSADAGKTWVNKAPMAARWLDVAMSADGKRVFAVVSEGVLKGIWGSIDGGGTWDQVGATNVVGLTAVACSADGKTVIAAAKGGDLFIATNGNDKYPRFAPSNKVGPWESVSVSRNGQTVVAVGTTVAIKTKIGWQDLTEEGAWIDAAISDDGTFIWAVQAKKLVQINVIAKTTTEVAVDALKSIVGVICSGTGTLVTLAETSGGIWQAFGSAPLALVAGSLSKSWRTIRGLPNGQEFVAATSQKVLTRKVKA